MDLRPGVRLHVGGALEMAGKALLGPRDPASGLPGAAAVGGGRVPGGFITPAEAFLKNLGVALEMGIQPHPIGEISKTANAMRIR